MALKLRPLYDRVLVRRDKTKTDVIVNGIVLPDNTIEKPEEGEVIAVGNGRIEKGERIPVDCSVGDRVVFGRFSGNEVEVLDEPLLLLREDELMGVYTID